MCRTQRGTEAKAPWVFELAGWIRRKCLLRHIIIAVETCQIETDG